MKTLPVLGELESAGEGTPIGESVLCRNNFNSGNVRHGGRLVVAGWEHATGLPPSWELAVAPANRAVNPAPG
ncbi:hypothetical protein [Umezawaea sp. Da 62-37]|uniref:hypothetical protein n=1 Tax=Umezawaea sp. Da 62-37 TaxID=3075927 RepID=UPI0028F745A3|nr:hypothetical protein [Umezawaea sp. Da 62-37]WNV86853.1 hypothetical protein RM788_00770 [Umezawaea sp. Da 62-37]